MGAAANFTRRASARAPSGNRNLRSHFENATEAVGLKMMFESVWGQPAMEEVTAQVAAQVETLYRENPPEFIYFLTLYHFFFFFAQVTSWRTTRATASAPGLKF